MSEKEKKILETVGKAVTQMSDFDKGYLLGFSESKVGEKKEKNTKVGGTDE
jgi:hypothetical protein